MKQRCGNKNDQAYPEYGGRGISVWLLWIVSFERFLLDMHPKPGPEYSLDRIDNDEGYHPDNCRWATKQEQGNNCRQNRGWRWRANS